MAEALVAGPVLSAVFNVLFEKMASKEVVDFFKQRQLNDEMLQKLKRRMNTVSGLLEDAEEKQITIRAVRNWLDDLKDVAYDADDILDEIAYKAREKQHLEAGPKTCSDQGFVTLPLLQAWKSVIAQTLNAYRMRDCQNALLVYTSISVLYWKKGVERSKEKIGPRLHASRRYILTTS